MRKNNILSILVAVFLFAFAQAKADNVVSLNNEGNDATEISLISTTETSTIISFKINSYSLKEVKTPRGVEYVVSFPESSLIMEAGAPDLPKITESLIISDSKAVEVYVVSSNYIEIENVNIAPSKGNFTRDIDPATVPYTYGKAYSNNAYYPATTATLSPAFIARDFRATTVNVTPFQYNPVTKVLRIYTEVVVEVAATEQQGENVFNRKSEFKTVSSEYKNIYSNFFINYESSLKYTPVEEVGNMLILCHGAFMETMQPFVEWKTMKGISVEMLDVAQAGTTAAAIKTFVTNYYNTNDLTFLLLVGDAAQIPTNTGGSLGGPSDNAYGYISGNDHYQEFLVGRFSAENIEHVATQVQRVINYEKYPMAGAEWYSTFASISSNQGPGDDNEMDYEHLRNIQTDLEGFTYTDGYEMFDGNQGGDDASGNPTPAMVGDAVNQGVSIINYTGHGSDTSWGSSGFSNSDVNNLTNDNKLPFIWSVACVNGNFQNQTCFGEAWMRATNGDQPAGAIGIMASTINQSWNPPMAGQDEMNDILVESYTTNIKRTFGGLSINGCFLMNEENGAGGDEMTDTWTLFGDPSVWVRTAAPVDMVVSHLPTLFLGMGEFTVDCATEGALVALSIDGVALASGLVQNGSVALTFDPVTLPGMLDVVVTGFNKMPYIAEVQMIPAEGPYVVLHTTTIVDATGNANGLADYNENIVLNLALRNVGVEVANGVSATITTDDEFINITNGTHTFGNINANEIIDYNAVYGFTVANNVPNGHYATFAISIIDTDNNVWNSTFRILLNAPAFEMEFVSITDASGNNNGMLDPGETVSLDLALMNLGHATSENITCTISSTSSFVSVINATQQLNGIAAESTGNALFNVMISGSTPIGEVVDFTFTLTAGQYTATITVLKKVGLVIEDWETGDFTGFDWEFTGAAWTISPEAYEGSNSAVSGTINDGQTTAITLTLTVGADDVISFYKKVSSENNYDYLRFFIDGIKKGEWAGDVAWSMEEFPVTAGTHTLKWSYEKDGSVSSGSDCAWIDYIVLPGGSGTVVVAPEFTSTPVVEASQGSAYTYNIAATHENGTENLIINCPVKPEWLNFTDNGNGQAILTGTANEGGEYNVALSVTNGTSTATQLFAINVAFTNYAPVFASSPLNTVNEEVEYIYAISVTDQDGDNLTIAGTYPTWLTLTQNANGSATLSGTPNDSEIGQHTILLTATDGVISTPVEQTFTITVASVNDIPVITSTPVTEIIYAEQYVYNFVSEDADLDAVLQITVSSKPSWLSLTDNGNGTALISGLPTQADYGTHQVTILVSDGIVSTPIEQTFTITVGAPTGVTDMAVTDFNVYPNPVKVSALIAYSVNTDSNVKIAIYNLLGEEVAVIINQNMPAGEHNVRFNATKFESGIYLCRLIVGNNSVTKKIIVTR